MAIINNTPLVAKSTDIHAAALNLNAKAFEVRKTIAGVWDLKPTAAKAPESAFNLDMKNDSGESVVEGDDRVRVDDKHFQAGGKYRSIVKLFLRYEFGGADQWAHGTGWLIRPDILVTAGHCAYDWGHRLGRAVEVKAYIGYKGRDQLNDPNVQFRSAKRIVTSEGWLQTKGSKPKDVSLIQLDKPFEDIVPVKYIDTPPMDDVVLGVVGYPADLKNEKTGEKGAFMYEHFLSTKYDIAEQADTMLEYQIDTFGGNSGSPVLRQADGVAIGVHVYGGAYNSASVIGKFGNPVSDYIRAFGLPLPDNGGLNFINTAEAASAPNGVAPAAKSGPPESSLQAYAAHVQALEYAPEGFIDLLKSVVRVGAPILGGAGSVVPIFNPILGPISSLVGVAVDSALKVTTESSQEGFFDSFQAVGKKFNATSVNIPAAKRTIGAGSAMESSIDPPSSEQAKPADPKADKAAISRAVLREAALQAILSKDLKPEVQESLFEMIRDIVKTTVPIIEKVLPVLTPAAAVAVDSFIASQNAKGQTESSTESYSSNEEAFLSNLQKAQSKSKKNGESFVNAKGESSFQNGVVSTEEGMFDFIGDAVRSVGKIGQIVGVPIIGTVGNIVGLQGMGQIAAGGFKYVDQAGRLISAESSFESQPEGIFDTLRNIGDFAINRGPGLIRMGGTVLIGGGKGSIDPSLLGIARSGIIASAGMESALQTTRSTHGEEESSFAIGKGSRFSGAESSSDPPQSSPSPTYTAISLVDLIKRAFFAEAALQAVLKVDPKLLNQEEGWFDDLSDAVSDIGNSIGNTAEQVANGAAQAGQQVFDTVKNGVESAADAAARAAVQASIEKAQRGERQWMRRGE